MKPIIRILESAADIQAAENVHKQVWGEPDIVPAHILMASVHNGGLLMGAYLKDELVGFVFGFPGFVFTPDGVEPKHASHMLAVLPSARSRGIGFALKRAQWQMVRRQGVNRITWTYDPLLSTNAQLNIVRLGAVCNTYYREFYGEMGDDLNAGLPSDRLEIDMWVNSSRVVRRMSKQPRRALDLAHFLAAGAHIVNPTHIDASGWPRPPAELPDAGSLLSPPRAASPAFHLVEIPSNFQTLRAADPALGLVWRLHIRSLLENFFTRGYLITDFIYLRGETPRSFYVLSDGERTLG